MRNNLLTVDKLLSYDLFYDNEYLHKYVDLINSNINREKEKYITERHHIIPRVYYKKNKLDVDNSEDNLVNLIYCDHVLAHCLLCLSFKYDYYISASIDAIYAVINNNTDKNLKYSNLEDIVANFEYLKPLLKCKHFVDEDQKIKLSVISSNSRWYNNGVEESFTRYKPEGDLWVPGRLPLSNEQKIKMSEYSKNCKWYNDGVKSYFTSKPDASWKLGRLGMNGKDNPSSRPDVKAKISKAIYNKPKATSKKCICVETGQVFESTKIAARWLGQKLSVDQACKEPWRVRGGYHWRYVD